MGGSFPLRGQEKMNHRRCCGFPICSRREKGGVAEHQWGVRSGRGLLMHRPRLESRGEKSMCMRSRCFIKPFFPLG